MSSGQLVTVLRHLRRVVGAKAQAGNSDRQLLARYLANKDEIAFAAIVERHGGMVWGVCRRVLDDPNDADDVFQAAFLVLLNRAAALRRRKSLAGWLQGVAWRLARKSRAQIAHRKTKEGRATFARADYVDEAADWSDLRCMLDEELNQLAERYRLPVILCYLEGKSYVEAAALLGWRQGTVAGRLARARVVLRRRLTRRGVALGTATLTATSVEPAVAPAAAVAAVAQLTRATLLCHAVDGAGSTTAVVLARGLLETMALSKLKLAATGVALLFVGAVGAGLVTARISESFTAPAPDPETPIAVQPPTRSASDVAAQARKDFYGDPLPPGALARMGSVQFRQPDAEIAFSSDGNTLISVGSDQSIMQRDVRSGKVLAKTSVPLQKSQVKRLSPDGKILAVGGADCILLYDTATGAEQRRFEVKGWGGEALAFSGNGKYLSCATPANPETLITIWDLATGKEQMRLRANLRVPDRVVFIIEASDAQQRRTLDGNANTNVRAAFFSWDGSVFGLRHGQNITLWDTSLGQILAKDLSSPDGFALSNNGQLLALTNFSGSVHLQEIPSLKRLAVLDPAPRLRRSTPLTPKLAFSPNGEFLAVGGIEGLILWDIAARKEKARFDDRAGQRIAFAPDGKTMAVAGKSTIRVWDVISGKPIHGRMNHDGRVGQLTVSPDGKLVASIEAFSPTEQLWDVKSGQPVRTISHSDTGNRHCSFAADGKLLDYGMPGGALELVEAQSGKSIQRFADIDQVSGRPPVQIHAAHLAKDGKKLMILSRSYDETKRYQLSVLDAETGKPIVRRVLPEKNFLSFAAFPPNGKVMAVGRDGGLSILETMTGYERLKIPGDFGYPMLFSPSGDLAAVGLRKTDAKTGPAGEDLGLRVMEVASGEELFHVNPVRPVAFSRDSRMLATASLHALELWDAVTGARLFHLPWPKEYVSEDFQTGVSSLALTPDGHAALVGMPDGTILVWDLSAAARPESWVREGKLGQAELETLWSDLGGDAKKGQRAVHILAATPEKALPLLASRLQPVAAVNKAEVTKLIQSLDDIVARNREQAARVLAQLGEQISPELRHRLEENPSAEARSQIGAILSGWSSPPKGELLRVIRAIQALRMIGTPAARQILEKLTAGAPNARETVVARDALEN